MRIVLYIFFSIVRKVFLPWRWNMVTFLDPQWVIERFSYFVGDPDLSARIKEGDSTSRLDEDLSFDSISLLEIQLGFDTEHETALSCEAINNCLTLGDLVALVSAEYAAVDSLTI